MVGFVAFTSRDPSWPVRKCHNQRIQVILGALPVGSMLFVTCSRLLYKLSDLDGGSRDGGTTALTLGHEPWF